MLDTVVSGGVIVTDGTSYPGDVGMKDGVIAGLWRTGEAPEANETVDASGKFVMPGGIDVHMHTQTGIASANARADTMESAGVSAALAGITTIIPYVWGDHGQPVIDYLGKFLELAGPLAVTDYSAHCGLLPDMRLMQQIPDAIDMGITSFKMHMDYRKTGHGRMSDDDHRLAAMEIIAKHGGLAMFHCENGYIIDYLEDKFIAGGNASHEYYLKSRPNASEGEAVHRTIVLAQLADCPAYVVHLSTKEGLAEIAQAQSAGHTVYTETCPQYLTLTHEALDTWGLLAKVGPPLRSSEDNAALWEGLRSGVIETVGSDHSAYRLDWKQRPVDNYFLSQVGTSVVEVMMPLVYSEGVVNGRISLEQFVSAFTEHPARRFGLYPRKGTLQPGADADVALWDPEAHWTVRVENLSNPCGYSIFDGWNITGRPVRTWLRGHTLLQNGEIQLRAGSGQMLRRGVVG